MHDVLHGSRPLSPIPVSSCFTCFSLFSSDLPFFLSLRWRCCVPSHSVFLPFLRFSYVAYKFLDASWVNFLLTLYLTAIGFIALAETLNTALVRHSHRHLKDVSSLI